MMKLAATTMILILAGLAVLATTTETQAGIEPDGSNDVSEIRPSTPCLGFPCSALRCEEWMQPPLTDTSAALFLAPLGLLGLRFWPKRKEREPYTWGTEADAEAARQALARMPESMRRRK